MQAQTIDNSVYVRDMHKHDFIISKRTELLSNENIE